jgi:hypothetical protein
VEAAQLSPTSSRGRGYNHLIRWSFHPPFIPGFCDEIGFPLVLETYAHNLAECWVKLEWTLTNVFSLCFYDMTWEKWLENYSPLWVH